MSRYGTDMELKDEGGTRAVRGFFQAAGTGRMSMETEAMALGEVPRGRYLYLGPVSAGAGEGDTITLGGRDYLLRRVENFYFGGEPIYQWGLCTRKGSEDEWGS